MPLFPIGDAKSSPEALFQRLVVIVRDDGFAAGLDGYAVFGRGRVLYS